MMKKETNYSKVLERLKKTEPVLADKNKLINEVMASVQKGQNSITVFDKLSDFLFGWVQNPWMRTGMAIISLSFLISFSYQQFVISKRINSLERQLADTEITREINDPGFAVSQRVLLKLIINQEIKDSLVVSKNDLEYLMESYSNMEKDYKYLLREGKENPFINEKLIKNNKPGKYKNL